MKNIFIKLAAVSLFACTLAGCAFNADFKSDAISSKKVTINAVIGFEGAYPEELLNAAANNNGNAKTAITGSTPQLINSNWMYKVEARCLSDNTKPVVRAEPSGTDGKKFSITLDSPARWEITTYAYFPGNAVDPELRYLINTKEITLTDDDPIPDVLIQIKPDCSEGGPECKGFVELSFDKTTWSSLGITSADGELVSEEGMVFPDDITDGKFSLDWTVPSGVYKLILVFKNSGKTVYSCTETVNVYTGFKTTRWWGNAPYLVPDNALNPTKYTFKLTDEVVSMYRQKNIYIKADSGPDYLADNTLNKDGTVLRPFSTIKAAFKRLSAINDGQSQYKIIFMSDLTCNPDSDTDDGFNYGCYDIAAINKDLKLSIESDGTVHTITSTESDACARFFKFTQKKGRTCNVSIKNLVFEGSSADSEGGFIDFRGASPQLKSKLTLDNVYIKSSVSNRAGGAIYTEFSTLELLNGTAIGNKNAVSVPLQRDSASIAAIEDGGAIYSQYSDVTIGEDCIITDCYTEEYGGAICFSGDGCTLTLKGCTIQNSSARLGGGISVDDGPCTIYMEDSIIKNCNINGETLGSVNLDSRGRGILLEDITDLHIKGRSYIDIENEVVLVNDISSIILDSDMVPQAANNNYVARLTLCGDDAYASQRDNQPLKARMDAKTAIIKASNNSYMTQANIDCFGITSTVEEYNDYPISAGKSANISYKYGLKVHSSGTKAVVALISDYEVNPTPVQSYTFVPNKTIIARDSGTHRGYGTLSFTVKDSTGRAVTPNDMYIAICQAGEPVLGNNTGIIALDSADFAKLPVGSYGLYMRASVGSGLSGAIIDHIVPISIVEGLDSQEVTVDLLKEMSEMTGLGSVATKPITLYLTKMPTNQDGLRKFNQTLAEAKVYVNIYFIPVDPVTFGGETIFGAGNSDDAKYIKNIVIGPGVTFGSGYMFMYLNLQSLIVLTGVTNLGKMLSTQLAAVSFEDQTGTWYYTTNSNYTGGTACDGMPDATQLRTVARYWYKVSN